MRKNWAAYLILVLALAGIVDAAYLTFEHYSNTLPPCHTGIFVDCGKVLLSKYSVLFGVPVAVIGVFQYLSEAVLLLLIVTTINPKFKKLLIIMKIGKRKLKMSSGEVRTFKSEKKRDKFEKVAMAVKHGFKPKQKKTRKKI